MMEFSFEAYNREVSALRRNSEGVQLGMLLTQRCVISIIYRGVLDYRRQICLLS